MKIHPIYFFLFVTIWFTMSSCASKKAFNSIADQPSEPDQKLREIESGNLDFDWYFARGTATVNFEQSSLTSNAEIRIKKDSAILVVLRMIGLEIGRALITRDSFFLINRMEGNYMAEPVDFISGLYKIPFLYPELEQIMIGNHLVKGMKALELIESKGIMVLKTSGERMNAVFQLNRNEISSAKYVLPAGDSMEMFFERYESVAKKKRSPLHRTYFYPVKENAEFSLELHLDEVELNKEKSMKFEIPSKYTRI